MDKKTNRKFFRESTIYSFYLVDRNDPTHICGHGFCAALYLPKMVKHATDRGMLLVINSFNKSMFITWHLDIESEVSHY